MRDLLGLDSAARGQLPATLGAGRPAGQYAAGRSRAARLAGGKGSGSRRASPDTAVQPGAFRLTGVAREMGRLYVGDTAAAVPAARALIDRERP